MTPFVSLQCVFSHLHSYSFIPYFPAYTIILPYTFIIFQEIFLPTRLFRPTLVLGTLEYVHNTGWGLCSGTANRGYCEAVIKVMT